MLDLAGTMVADSRAPIERLDRYQLWQYCKAYNVQCPPNATVDVMRPLLTALGIDVLKPVPDPGDANIPQWQMVETRDDQGRTRMEPYPVHVPAYTETVDIDRSAVMDKIRRQQGEEAARIEALQAELRDTRAEFLELKKMNDLLRETLEGRRAPKYKVGLPGMNRMQLRKICRESGIELQSHEYNDRIAMMKRIEAKARENG